MSTVNHFHYKNKAVKDLGRSCKQFTHIICRQVSDQAMEGLTAESHSSVFNHSTTFRVLETNISSIFSKIVFSISDYTITKNMLAITNDGEQDIFGAVTCNLVHRIDENNQKNDNLLAVSA